jgi:hypothetical protein
MGDSTWPGLLVLVDEHCGTWPSSSELVNACCNAWLAIPSDSIEIEVTVKEHSSIGEFM